MRNNPRVFEMSRIEAHVCDLCVEGAGTKSLAEAGYRARTRPSYTFCCPGKLNRLFDRIHFRTPEPGATGTTLPAP